MKVFNATFACLQQWFFMFDASERDSSTLKTQHDATWSQSTDSSAGLKKRFLTYFYKYKRGMLLCDVIVFICAYLLIYIYIYISTALRRHFRARQFLYKFRKFCSSKSKSICYIEEEPWPVINVHAPRMRNNKINNSRQLEFKIFII